MAKETLFKALPVIILSSLLVVAIIYAWTEPTTSPPGGNVAAPINVGSTAQIKQGALTLNQADVSTTGLIVYRDAIFLGGNVGIGTASPGAKLEVAGQIKITGGSPGPGKVLTSGPGGLASWQPPTPTGTPYNVYQCPYNICDNNSASTCAGQLSFQASCQCRADGGPISCTYLGRLYIQ